LTTSTSNNSQTTTLVNNGNATTIIQGVNAKANTGGNKADRNISIGGVAGGITTGNATTNTNMLVTANGTVALIGGNGNGNGPGSGASIVVSNTGDRTRISGSKNTTNFVVVTNSNRATLSQMCGTPIPQEQLLVDASSCSANTGNNDASRNIGLGGDAGVINTGDATVNVLMKAVANSNATEIENGGGSAPLTLAVANTGNDSQFDANQNSQTSTGVSNSNNAAVSQSVNAKANTGRNSANRNISIGGNAGIINTGDATVNTLMLAQLNSNETEVSQGSGQGGTGQSLAVENTGDDSEFNSDTNSTNNTQVNNHNELSLFQQIVAYAKTGFNKANRNIGNAAGIIDTGDAMIDAIIDIDANHNETKVTQSSSSSAPAPSPTPGQSSSSSSSSSSSNNSSSSSSSSSSNNGSSSSSGGVAQGVSVSGSSSSTNGTTNATLADFRDKPRGMVLGAVSLPATGPGSSLLVLIMLILLLGAGIYAQKFDTNEV
jgi:hypothetical protein